MHKHIINKNFDENILKYIFKNQRKQIMKNKDTENIFVSMKNNKIINKKKFSFC